jgi:hypothetical protein
MKRIGATRNSINSEAVAQLAARRSPITRAALERAISDAVRGSSPECSGLVGVIVERIVPAAPGGANWGVKGIRYGKAKRDRCRMAIAVCVEDGQRQFVVSD